MSDEAKIDPMASGMKCSPSQAIEHLANAIGTMDAEERSTLCKRIADLEKAINKAEREISEAVRVGAGRGEEFVLAAHRTLTGTGAVTGYTAKPVVSPCGCIYKVCQDNAIFENVYCKCQCHKAKATS